MHALVKTDWRQILLAALGLACFSQALADFKVTEAQPTLTEAALLLTANLDLNLSPKVEEALAKGIPLEVNIDIRLYRHRRFLWNTTIADWTLRRRVQYHALSGQYLLSSGEPGAEIRESLLTQQAALKQLGALNDLKLAIKKSLPPDKYLVDIRVSLDIEALPTPLRPVAYTTPSWHLNSGWTTWKVAP